MYYSSWREWFIYIGIFCIIAGVIVGFISITYGINDILLILNFVFLNTFSIFGYIFLSLGLFLHYFKLIRNKRDQKLKPKTQKFSSFKDFVQDKTAQKAKENEEEM